jgi:hypothetical protein
MSAIGEIVSMKTPQAAITVLCLLFTPLLLTAGEGQIRRKPNAVKGEYIVVLNDDTPRGDVPAVAHQLVGQHGGSAHLIWQDVLKGYLAYMTDGQAQGLSHNPKIKYIEENALAFLSGTQSTRIHPASGDTNRNWLWHLDVLDQNNAVGSGSYSYCTDGSSVHVYVVDTGVMRAHQEFGGSATRVTDGYNASGDCLNRDAYGHCLASQDYYPAYDPCHGFRDDSLNSHGTAVGSLVAGSNVGVAKNATIVPVKVWRCGESVAQYVQSNTTYSAGIIVANDYSGYHYIAMNSGTTGSGARAWDQTEDAVIHDGGVDWRCLRQYGQGPGEVNVGMIIEGLDWIVRLGLDGQGHEICVNLKLPAVVTMSIFSFATAPGVTTPFPGLTVIPGEATSLEDAVATILRPKLNSLGVVVSPGIPLIASANNQGANACDTSPARMSRGNPNNTYPGDIENPQSPYRVITVGGTMINNNPDSSSAGSAPETYDATKPTTLRRWKCGPGDTDDCSVELGSSGGQCVTLFAPAKNVTVANMKADSSGLPRGYRDPTVTNGVSSGTSWSSPIVAGVVARILQSNPTYTVAQVYSTLMSYTTGDLDTTELDPPGVTGTPNKLLHIPDVIIAALPATTSGPVTASATGSAPLTYQWYQVNSNFTGQANAQTPAAGQPAAASTLLSGATSATLSVSPSVATSYFVRVSSSCGSADSNFTTFVPCQAVAITTQPSSNPTLINPGSSSTLSITVSGGAPVTVQWFTSTGTFVGAGTSISVAPTVNTTYHAIVSNSCGSLQSSNCLVNVCAPPTLTSPFTATPSTITAGGGTLLNTQGANSNGGGRITYLWYKSDGTFLGTSLNKRFGVGSIMTTTSYYYEASNSCGTSVASTLVTVTVQ